MAYRTFRPTPASLLPEILVLIGQGFLTAIWWNSYAYRPTIKQLALAVLMTLFFVYFIAKPVGYVAMQRITLGPYGVESGPVGRQRVLWRDVKEVRVSEKYRPWRGARRTDRMVCLYTNSPRSFCCNPSAWPQRDEDEFLGLLEQKSLEYGFLISRRTTKI